MSTFPFQVEGTSGFNLNAESLKKNSALFLIILEGFDNFIFLKTNISIDLPSDLSPLCSKPLLGSCAWNFFQASSHWILVSESSFAKVSGNENRAGDIARVDDDHDEAMKISNTLEKSFRLMLSSFQ